MKSRVVAASIVLAVGLLAGAGAARAQQPVWVFLTDKAVRSGALVKKDHAIPPGTLEQIERTGARIRFTSRWLKAVSVDADRNAIAKLERLPYVTSIAPVNGMYAVSSGGGVWGAGEGGSGGYEADRPLPPSHTPPLPEDARAARDDIYGPNITAIQQLGVPPAHELGFTGRGIRIAILDTGFEPGHESLSTRRIAAQRDFINNDATVADEPGDANTNQEAHGTAVWSILGGYAPGKIVGPAYDATFILAKVDFNDPSTIDRAVDEDRWVAAVEWADSMGARIISSSLAYRKFSDKPSYPDALMNGDATPSARMADEAARRGILIVTAIGNNGPEPTSLLTPADADSVIAVGAVDTLGVPAVFDNGLSTSRGPTADGRLKPELVAVGKGLVTANSANATSYNTNQQGTSLSTPYVAGGAAMFMQAWPNLTIMAVRNALMLSGSRAELPDNNVGFGVPNISSAILFPEGLLLSGITSVNLENELTTIQPTFTWSAPLVNGVMRPVRYRLEIAAEPTFETILYSDTITDLTSLTLKKPLLPRDELYWRVTAQAFGGVTRTTRVSSPFSMPPWVRLLTFSDPAGAFTDSLRPTFRWESLSAPPPSGPLIFDVQILNAQTGIPVVSMRNITTSSAQPPSPLAPNIAYRWRVIARSQTGAADTVQTEGVFVVTTDQAPPATLLYQNFPNPFPRSDLGETGTHVWFDVNTATTVELAIYDLRGRLVRRLIPNAESCGTVLLTPGIYGRSPADPNPCVTTSWDARDSNGSIVPRGVYILRLRAGGAEQIKKILYMPVD